MSTFDELLAVTGILTRRHATTQAHKCAHFLHEDNPNGIPLGLQWISWEDAKMEEPVSEDKEDQLSDLSGTPDNPGADITLANSMLFIQNAIWW